MDRKVGRLFVSPPSLDMAELMQEQDPVSHASAGGPLPSRRSGRTTAADADNGTTPATTSVALFIDDLGFVMFVCLHGRVRSHIVPQQPACHNKMNGATALLPNLSAS